MRRRQVFAEIAKAPIPAVEMPKMEIGVFKGVEFTSKKNMRGYCKACGKYIGKGVGLHMRRCNGNSG